MRVTIIGHGAWGSALFELVKQNQKDVSFAKRGEVIEETQVIILATPTQSIRDALSLVGKTEIIVNTSKGIEAKTHKFPFQIVQEYFPLSSYYSLIGPSFAQEVSEKMPTIVNLGYMQNNASNQLIKNLFQTENFRVRLSKNVEALELSAAMKNIYAIGCGLAEGFGYKTNTRVELILLAIEELQKLFKGFGLKVGLDALTGTIGDLILTCNSAESRNFRFGQALATLTTQESLEKINSTIEGFHTLESITFLEKKASIHLPLASFIKETTLTKSLEVKKKLFEKFISLV